MTKPLSRALHWGGLVLLSVLVAAFLTPFFVVILNSFKTTEQFVNDPFALPTSWTVTNYAKAIAQMDFLRGFLNSLILTCCSVALVVLSSSMTAHLFVRKNWTVNRVLFAAMVSAMVIPFQSLMIPLVQIYGGFHLLNNKFILIFMYMGFGVTFAVFMFHGFLKSVPVELEEAAIIDGCNEVQKFFIIVFPLMRSVIMTVIVLDMLWIWNDYLLPALVLLSPQERTLPLSTYSFFSTYAVDFGPLMAALVMTTIPVIVVYLFGQKQITKGIIQGAIK